jgi:hypothetical protein
MHFLAILFTAVALLTGQPQSRTTDRPAAAQPKLSDAQIQARIQAKLAKSKIGRNGFKFTTVNGVTTIEGKAGVIQHKGAATRMAKTAGARAVVNNIQISDEARAAARSKLSASRRVSVTRSERR